MRSPERRKEIDELRRFADVRISCDISAERRETSSFLDWFAGPVLHCSGCFGLLGLATDRRTQQGSGAAAPKLRPLPTRGGHCVIDVCVWR